MLEDFKPTININYKGKTITSNQINILKAILKTKSQNKAARILKIPPSSINIQIKRLENKLNTKLIYSSPSGTMLTEEGIKIIDHFNSIQNRLKDNEFIACGFVSGEIGKLLFDDVIVSSFDNVLKLYNMGLTKIIGVDDPYWSFRVMDGRFLRSEGGLGMEKDGDVYPIAYDYFVMVYKDEFDFKNLVGIRYSAQRIVWKILKNEGIPFKITTVVKNPLHAIELVEDGYSLFLNKSFSRYINKCNIEEPKFYEKTKHTINFIGDLNNMEKLIEKRKKKIKRIGFDVIY
ncbi:helix-turn-helix domain-containing protein [Methanotorris formicicus]|uniref:Transcriptional regulator, LysR family n=1 Tax=Methanotorris formicicus Mc-S-70 TaxID=647171 RepID=H1KXB1_9EURY|nr:LysR family transcriptional regulator [Methanotorris formicicus]EHP88323.1 transcriptional regulator, LysR family [Methanotorris formicicus Mc-S-70]